MNSLLKKLARFCFTDWCLVILLVLLGSSAFGQHKAHAQTQGDITLKVTEVRVNGAVVRDDPEATNQPFSAAECADPGNVELLVVASNTPSGTNFVDLWSGNSNQDCSTETARVTGTDRICDHLLGSDPALDSADNSFVVTLDEIVGDSDACSSTVNQGVDLLLWAFAAGATETTGAVTADQFGYVAFTVDAAKPSSPVPEQSEVSGESGVRISWPGIDNHGTLYFNVYTDATVGADCVDAGQINAGEAAPASLPSGVLKFEQSNNATSASLVPSQIGLADGESAAVYVTSVDLAENESVLSASVCLTRVPTAGFCEVVGGMGGECGDSCSVSTPGFSSPNHATWVVWMLFGWLALLGLRTQRHNQRRQRYAKLQGKGSPS